MEVRLKYIYFRCTVIKHRSEVVALYVILLSTTPWRQILYFLLHLFSEFGYNFCIFAFCNRSQSLSTITLKTLYTMISWFCNKCIDCIWLSSRRLYINVPASSSCITQIQSDTSAFMFMLRFILKVISGSRSRCALVDARAGSDQSSGSCRPACQQQCNLSRDGQPRASRVKPAKLAAVLAAALTSCHGSLSVRSVGSIYRVWSCFDERRRSWSDFPVWWVELSPVVLGSNIQVQQSVSILWVSWVVSLSLLTSEPLMRLSFPFFI